MVVNRPISGQSIAGIASIDCKNGIIRSTGSMEVDTRKNFHNPDASDFLALSAEDVAALEYASSLVHALCGNYESGDPDKVLAETIKDREAKTVIEEPV